MEKENAFATEYRTRHGTFMFPSDWKRDEVEEVLREEYERELRDERLLGDPSMEDLV